MTARKAGRPKKNGEKVKAIIRPVSFKQDEQWLLEAFEEKSFKPFSFSYMVKRLIIDYVNGKVSLPYEPYIPNMSQVPFNESVLEMAQAIQRMNEADKVKQAEKPLFTKDTETLDMDI